MSKYKVSIKGGAEKTFSHLPKELQQKIVEAFFGLSADPYSRDRHIKKLSGYTNAYRMRIGRWRIFYNIDDQKYQIEVVDIFLRKEDSDYRRRQ